MLSPCCASCSWRSSGARNSRRRPAQAVLLLLLQVGPQLLVLSSCCTWWGAQLHAGGRHRPAAGPPPARLDEMTLRLRTRPLPTCPLPCAACLTQTQVLPMLQRPHLSPLSAVRQLSQQLRRRLLRCRSQQQHPQQLPSPLPPPLLLRWWQQGLCRHLPARLRHPSYGAPG